MLLESNKKVIIIAINTLTNINNILNDCVKRIVLSFSL